MFLGVWGSRTSVGSLGDCAHCELGRGRGAETAAWENCLEPCPGPGWLQPTREEAESRELVNFRILCHRPKQGDVRLRCCLPGATIASSPRGCWQGGGPCWGCCHPIAVVSASIHPGLTAFERKLHVVLIILLGNWFVLSSIV